MKTIFALVVLFLLLIGFVVLCLADAYRRQEREGHY